MGGLSFLNIFLISSKLEVFAIQVFPLVDHTYIILFEAIMKGVISMTSFLFHLSFVCREDTGFFS